MVRGRVPVLLVPGAAADWGALEGVLASTHTLTITRHRFGAVDSADPTKIDCGKRCVATFVERSRVELTATPKRGYAFQRWTGGCRGRDGATCVVRINQAKSVGVRFTAAG